MYDHELTVAIQQERERAIREARMYHRNELLHEPTWMVRLLAGIRFRLRGAPVVVRPDGPVLGTDPGQAAVPVTPCRAQGSGSRPAAG